MNDLFAISIPELEEAGYRRFEWNDGTIIEYWKTLFGKDDFNYKLAVRFGEYKSVPFIVWLFLGTTMCPLTSIKTVQQLEQFYGLISGGTIDLVDYVLSFKENKDNLPTYDEIRWESEGQFD